MIVTGSSVPIRGGSNGNPSTPAKISSNKDCGGASPQLCRIPSRNAASPQHTSDGVQSFIIATNSAGACREYSGTTISPSAMSARSIATQRMLLAASNPHRSPFLSPFEAINVLALPVSSSNSLPVTPLISPSRISARIRVSAASRSCENISSTNGMKLFKIWIATLPLRGPPNSSCRQPLTLVALCPSAANNPPNSTLRGVSETPDTFSALPLRNTHPCGPSSSNSSSRFAQSRSQSPPPHNSAFPEPPAASPQARDRPPSSADPDAPAPALNSGCAHPS